MLYAPLDLFGVATFGGFGAGQAHTVYPSVAQEAAKTNTNKGATDGT